MYSLIESKSTLNEYQFLFNINAKLFELKNQIKVFFFLISKILYLYNTYLLMHRILLTYL